MPQGMAKDETAPRMASLQQWSGVGSAVFLGSGNGVKHGFPDQEPFLPHTGSGVRDRSSNRRRFCPRYQEEMGV